ncbi:Peroxisomal biogenesis factor 7 [Oopsacas minuta]|uniref:Peroxin-7 n=1 Tax=Oopsacas minuta TaxID=111878 RepID=A0AAV7JUT4_9METZ|nr:Peroxisomal biogenesis factor 7 [Oopsacas minuta]
MGARVKIVLASVLPLPNLHHFSIKSSNTEFNRLALTSGENYGLKGSGFLTIIDTNHHLQVIKQFQWSDALFDVTWGEQYNNIAVTVSGDGSFQVWDISEETLNPKLVIKAHSIESCCVEWDVTNIASRFLTTSWDKTLKVWDISEGPICICEISHPSIVYSGQWAPFSPHLIAIAGSDGYLVQRDLRNSKSQISAIQAHQPEILSCSWSPQNQFTIATGGCDRYVKIWDTRQLQSPITILTGQRQTVKRVKMNPHSETLLGSCGYDNNWILWDYSNKNCLFVSNWHTNFCYGFDFDRNVNGQFYTCAWDSKVISARYESKYLSKL